VKKKEKKGKWEVWFCSQLGVPIPELIGPLRPCPCNAFLIDYFGNHLQTCQSKSAATQVHDWVVLRLGGILSSVDHRVKINNIIPASGKERGDVDFDAYVFWKITDVFSGTVDAHQTDGWCTRS
jgi:hypothetical protein